MALQDILDAIQAEADAEVKNIITAADEECAALLSRAREQARDEEERLSQSRDHAADRQADRIINRARLDADRMLRSARERLFDRARGDAAERLAAFRGTARYEEVFANLVTECLAALPEATTLRVEPADEDLARRVLTGDQKHGLNVEAVSDGAIELTDGCGRSVRNDFASRLDRAEDLLRLIFAEHVRAAP